MEQSDCLFLSLSLFLFLFSFFAGESEKSQRKCHERVLSLMAGGGGGFVFVSSCYSITAELQHDV